MMNSFWYQLKSLTYDLRAWITGNRLTPAKLIAMKHRIAAEVEAEGLGEYPELPEVGEPAFPSVRDALEAGDDTFTPLWDGSTFRRGYEHMDTEALHEVLARMKKAERYEECQAIQNILDRRRDG